MNLSNYNTEETQPLILDAEGSYNMLQIARWGKFLAVTGIVFTGIMFLVLVVLGILVFGYFDSIDATKRTELAPNVVLLLMMIGMYVYPIYALYKFSVQSKRSITSNDQVLFNSSLRHLKGIFIFMGIIMIIMICLYALIFLAMFAFGGLASL